MSDKKITFGRVFWPSLIAVLVVVILFVVIFFVFIGSVVASEDKPDPKASTVLHMTLDGVVKENSSSKLDPLSFQVNETIGLSDLLYGIKQAQKDDKVKGIFIEMGNLSCGFATAKELREALDSFEKSGKFLVSYNRGEVITQKAYYLSSVAKEVYGFPSSAMQFTGLGGEYKYFKNLLDDLEIEMQVIRGSNNDFKSAVEPYFRSSMSDSSRLQTQVYIDGLWSEFKTAVAKDRGVSAEEIDLIADSLLIRRASDAVKYKLLDGVKYRDEILDLIADKAGESSMDDVALVSLNKYSKKKFYNSQAIARAKKANVAVVLAEGGVVTSGEGLASDRIVKHLRTARLDKNIKTIVLRVNSPGGSALASDEIWREVQLANESKTVIVSMGDVAASGGYYIAVPAAKIFAEPNTITGSIGVFGVIPFTGKMFENKLGITFDKVATNQHSVLSLNKKLTDEELKMVQEEIDFIYDEFLWRVAEGRGMTKEAVNQIARGRVWTGKDALSIGLVDTLGGLQDAIDYAVADAGINNPVIEYYPKKEVEPLEEILEMIHDEEENANTQMSTVPESVVKYYKTIRNLETHFGIQARMPMVEIK